MNMLSLENSLLLEKRTLIMKLNISGIKEIILSFCLELL